MQHSLRVLSSWLQAAVYYTFGKLAHNMLIGYLSLNVEDTADSNDHHRRHTQCDSAEVWLSNLEDI